MISEARLHANQRNAQRSTGPRTEAGKLRSRCNALKHGLTGRGEVLGADEAAAVERRSAEWADALRPSGEHEHWLARQAVLASLRIDRCQELERARRGMDAARALACWEEDRQRAAEALGARLSRAPAVVAAELRRSRQGCNWLLVRWRKLEDTLDVLGRWDDAHRSLALDLLGEPAEAREADLEHLSSAPPDELRAIVASEITALEDLKAEAMDDLDAAERALAEAGLPVEEGAEVRRLRHYESACWRALRWARQQLRSASPREPGPTTVPGPEDDELAEFATQAGAGDVSECLRRETFTPWVEAALERGREEGVSGTPTVRIDGEDVSGAQEGTIPGPPELQAAVEAARAS